MYARLLKLGVYCLYPSVDEVLVNLWTASSVLATLGTDHIMMMVWGVGKGLGMGQS